MNKTIWLLAALLGLALAVGAYRFFQGGPWDRHTVAGIAAYEQGDYAKAEEEWVAALAEAEAFGPEDTRLATSLNNLGEVYRTQGRYGDAEPLYNRALAINEKALGPDDPKLAASLNNLALLYDAQGRYEEAEPFYKRALAVYVKALGPWPAADLGQSPALMNAYNRSNELSAQGRYKEAIPFAKKALGL